MLTGAILPSAGRAFLGGFDIVQEQRKVRCLRLTSLQIKSVALLICEPTRYIASFKVIKATVCQMGIMLTYAS